MKNALQASATESILKQVYTRTQRTRWKFPIYIFDINLLNKKVIIIIFYYQILIKSRDG